MFKLTTKKLNGKHLWCYHLVFSVAFLLCVIVKRYLNILFKTLRQRVFKCHYNSFGSDASMFCSKITFKNLFYKLPLCFVERNQSCSSQISNQRIYWQRMMASGRPSICCRHSRPASCATPHSVQTWPSTCSGNKQHIIPYSRGGWGTCGPRAGPTRGTSYWGPGGWKYARL